MPDLTDSELAKLLEIRRSPKWIMIESDRNNSHWLKRAFMRAEPEKDAAEDLMWEVPEFGGEW